jgi:hypothetical protein
MCRCGYPFDPDIGYPLANDDPRGRERGPWRGSKPKRYCSARCARSWPARDAAERRRQEKARARLAAWEDAGQLTLW